MTYKNGLKAKQYEPFNSSIYAAINECNFIPDCAYEKIKDRHNMPYCIIECFISDNGKYIRCRIVDDKQIGICGIIYNKQSGLVLYGETKEEYRKKGLYKQLKALIYKTYKVRLWSQYQSDDLLNMTNKQ